MSNTIISCVEQLAKQDGMFIQTRSLIAGVDDTDDNDENKQDEDDNNDDDSEDEGNNEDNNDETNNNDEEDNNNEEVEEEEIVFMEDEEEEPPLFENYDTESKNENKDESKDKSETKTANVEEEQPIKHNEPRRSMQEPALPKYYTPSFEGQKYQHLHVQTVDNTKQYDRDRAIIGAIIINKINMKHHPWKALSILQTYTLKKGLKRFKKKGYDAAFGEMKQLHDRVCFDPINPRTMTLEERKKAMESLIFLTEKRDGRVKARTCANGSVQREWMAKEDTASPTTALESVIITAGIDAQEG